MEKENLPDRCATTVKPGHIASECYSKGSHKGGYKGCKGKGKNIRNVQGEWWPEEGQNWNNQEEQAPKVEGEKTSSSNQGNIRSVQLSRGKEQVRRFQETSTVTIEEVEDEVVDLIGMFNDIASGRLRMVREQPQEDDEEEKENEEDLIEALLGDDPGMPVQQQLLWIRWHGLQEVRVCQGLKATDRKSKLLASEWRKIKKVNDLVEAIISCLKDTDAYPALTNFLECVEKIYTEEDQEWREMKKEGKDECELGYKWNERKYKWGLRRKKEQLQEAKQRAKAKAAQPKPQALE